jgi:predicted GIY-YIG superfamily endonuclease
MQKRDEGGNVRYQDENGRCYMGGTNDRRKRSKEHSGIVEERLKKRQKAI